MRIYAPTGTRVIAPTGTRIRAIMCILDRISTLAAAAYGLRKLRWAYTGPLIKLRRSGDNAEKGFWAVGGDPLGRLNVAEILIWLGGDTGFVVTWYDQSGFGRNVVQATAGKQPILNSDGLIEFDGTNDVLAAVAFSTIAQPFEAFVVLKSTNLDATGDWAYGLNAVSPIGLNVLATTKFGRTYAGSGSVDGTIGLADGSYHQVTSRYDGASSLIRTDGGDESIGETGVTSADSVIIGGISSGSFDGQFPELLLLATPAAGDRAIIEADQAARYGVS